MVIIMKKMKSEFNKYDVRLRIFWLECLGLFLLELTIFLLNIVFKNEARVYLDFIFLSISLIPLILSFILKRISPFHYLTILISNTMIVVLTFFLKDISNIIVFLYASFNILFTYVLFYGKKRRILLSLETIFYMIIGLYLAFLSENKFLYTNYFIQTAIFNVIMVICFHSVFSMYKNQAKELKEINQQIKDSSLKDPLTNLWNRTYMNILLDNLLEEKIPFSIAMFDVDFFKKVNDTYGHIIGDRILEKFSKIIEESIPSNASAIRYGGEEFLVIFPNKNVKEVYSIAELIRETSQDELKLHDMVKTITISGGIKEYNQILSKEEFISEADKKLYQAKKEGRNKIVS